MNTLKKVLFAGACLWVFAAGCSSKRDTTEIHVSFPNHIWNRFQIVDTVFHVSNIEKNYDISLQLSVTDGFKLDIVPVEVVLISPDGQENIVNKKFFVKDAEENHIGNAFGDTWTVELPIYSEKEFSQQGDYRITVQNRTQYFDLPKVESLVITVAPAKRKKEK